MCHERKQGKKIRKRTETKENETTTGVYFTTKLFFQENPNCIKNDLCLYPFYRNRRLPTALLQANSFIQGPFVELSRSGIINDSPLDSNIIF